MKKDQEFWNTRGGTWSGSPVGSDRSLKNFDW